MRCARPSRVKEAPLESEQRQRIIGIVRASPGLNMARLARATGMKNATLKHHAGILVKCNLIVTRREGRALTYWPTGNAMPPRERAVRSTLHHEPSRRVLEAVARGYVTRASVAEALVVAQSVASWHLGRLVAGGFVVVDGEAPRRGGRGHAARAYRVADDVLALMGAAGSTIK